VLNEDFYVTVSEKTRKIINGGILIMSPNKVFSEYSFSQEQIKKMCIKYVKTNFDPSDTEALSKYFKENHHKLKFYIDEQGNPNFQDI
jgi:hypothetical protein